MSRRMYCVVETIGDGELLGKLHAGAFGEGAVESVKASENGAADRNALLSRVGDADFAILIDDTLMPNDASFAAKYESLVDVFGYSVLFYGYSRGANRVLGIKPNPGILLRTGPDSVLHVTQFPLPAMVVIDRRRNKLQFDENFRYSYLDEFLCRSAKEKLLPFNGFYLDAAESWTLFDEKKVTRTPERLKDELDTTRLERETLSKSGSLVNSENNVNMFIQYVQAKLAETGAK